MIYQATVRSVLDYGCKSTSKSTLINALLVEENDMPLNLHRLKLSRIYWKYMKSYVGNHITTDVLNNCWEYVNKKERGFGWSISPLKEKYQIAETERDSHELFLRLK